MSSKQTLVIAGAIAAVLLLGSVVVFSGHNEAAVAQVPELPVTADSQPYGVFEGRIPCGDCERIKVRLTLHRNPANNEPAEYLLERIYVGKGNDRLTTRGRWQTLEAPIPDRYGVAYRLDDAAPADFSTYLPVGGDILLFLNPDMRPRVGDASASFTLSRTK